VGPLIGGNHLQSVRSILKRVVLPVNSSFFNISDFFSDDLESVSETIHLKLIFTLSWFNHYATVHWPTHSRRVESKVDQTLSYVFFSNVSSLLERPEINNELVSNSAISTSVKNRVISSNLLSKIVAVEDGVLSRLSDSFLAQLLDESVGDGQNGG